MKFGQLKSIGHNIADSLASGVGLLIGVYSMDIFAEAMQSAEGYIEVDFLKGTSSGATVSSSLADAIALYSAALHGLCRRHGTDVTAFHELKVRYFTNSHGNHFSVTVGDRHGHRSTDEYSGMPGRRVKVLDALGRIRPKASFTP